MTNASAERIGESKDSTSPVLRQAARAILLCGGRRTMGFNNVANRFAGVDRETVRTIYNWAIQDAYLELRAIGSSLGKAHAHDMLTIDSVADRVKRLQAKSAAAPEPAMPGERATLELFGYRLENARKLARLYADLAGFEYDIERAIDSAILNEVDRLKRE